MFILMYTQALYKTCPASTLCIIKSLFISISLITFLLGEKYQAKMSFNKPKSAYNTVLFLVPFLREDQL